MTRATCAVEFNGRMYQASGKQRDGDNLQTSKKTARLKSMEGTRSIIEKIGETTKIVRPVSDHAEVRETLDRIAYRYKPGKDITEISHDEAKEILRALGVGKSLYEDAHRGNVIDAVKNSLAKQAVAFPSRFTRFATLGAFQQFVPEKNIAAFNGDELAFGRYKAGRTAHTKMLTYGGQHLRGALHFALNTLASPIDLSSNARSLPPQTFAKDGEIAHILLDHLRRCIQEFDAKLPQDLASRDAQNIRRKLGTIADSLQPEVDRFLEARSLSHAWTGRRIEDLLRSVTELVDTIGKIVIASAAEVAVPGLSKTGIQQTWSLVSYPAMDGIIRAMHNWRDTKTIARIALSMYDKAKNHLAQVSDESLNKIAKYAQDHFEDSAVANYGRRMTNMFSPELLEMRTRLHEMEHDQKYRIAARDSSSLAQLESIEKKKKLEDGMLADETRIAMSPADYSAGMNIVELLVSHLKGAALERTEVDALIDFNIEVLLKIYAAPTQEAKAGMRELLQVLKDYGFGDAENYLSGKFDRFLSDRPNEIKLIAGVDFHERVFPARPIEISYTESGRRKLEAKAQLERLEKNLKIRRSISRQADDIAALDDQIGHLSRNPAESHDGLDERRELARRKQLLERSIARSQKDIDELASRVDNYAADVESYKSKSFDAISEDGEVWKAVMTGRTGAGAAFVRNLRYNFLANSSNRRSLGIAMSFAYDPTLSNIGATDVVDDKFVNGVAEGVLNVSSIVPALTIPAGARFIKGNAPGLAHTSRNLAGVEGSQPAEARAPT